jgi:hypothetical protein
MAWDIPTIPSDAFLAEIRAEFLGTYRDTVRRSAKLPLVMGLGVGSDKRKEYYGYWESPPVPERWARGKSIPRESGQAITYSVTNLDWGKAIDFHENDLDDLKLGDIRTWAQGLARRFAVLPERVFFQILMGTVDSKLLPTIPSAPDGAALFAATANGTARFGVTGGNIVNGLGVGTGAQVRDSFMAAGERMRQFLDTKGEPLHDEALLEQSMVVVYGVHNEQVMREAFVQGRTLQSDANGAAAVTNVILDSGMKVTLWGTQRVTDDDLFVFANEVNPKPIFEQVRAPLRTIDETRENSSRARNEKILGFLADMRAGFGMNLPYACVKINN